MFFQFCSFIILFTLLHEGTCQSGLGEIQEIMSKMGPAQRKQMEQMMGRNGETLDPNEPGMGGPDGFLGGPDEPGFQPPPQRLGGEETPPRPPRQIAVKRARAVLTEVLALLTTKTARAEFESVRNHIPADMGPDSSQAMWQAVGPVAHRLTTAVMDKYEFTGGFDEALRSIEAAGSRQLDKTISDGLEDVNEIVTGQPAQGRIGRVAALDELADAFLSSSHVERLHAIAEAEKILDAHTVEGKLNPPAAKEYLQAMRGVVDKGVTYVQDIIVDLAVGPGFKKPSGGISPEERERLSSQINILTRFLRSKDHKIIRQRIEAVREAQKAARAGATTREEL